ncbi:beta-1,3-galactosyltransferase 5 [Hyperolius riggenbachi]|uniref:beta-1,3-galactosyltransferase 5 n=1 Tax=Hyperolius riggenbachi TaxID=752182 RepID=UPI0035A313D4
MAFHCVRTMSRTLTTEMCSHPRLPMISRKKIAFLIILCFPCAITVWFLVSNNDDFDLCYYCFFKDRNYFALNLHYKKGHFTRVPEAHCKESPPFLVLLVTTTHKQEEERMVIRDTWGKERLIHGKRVVTFFLLGSPADPSTDEDVSLPEEFNNYHDIIQKDFIDTYYNLTIKTLMGIDWVMNFCPQTTYIMKTDTDMFVNTIYLVELLLRKNQTTHFFTGILKTNDSPIRHIFSKWYISKREFAGTKYPPFCSGTGYVFSVDVARRIYTISLSIPFFKLEDVYIGMCLNKLKISLQELHTSEVFFASKPIFSVCTYRNLVTAHELKPQEIALYWKALQQAQNESC